MKRVAVLTVLGLAAATGAQAQPQPQEVGRVISSTPVVAQVAVPRQVCSQQPMAVQQPGSGGGAIVGAIVGGLLGNTIGHGMGRAAATGIGMVAGAAIGDNVEGRGQYAAVPGTQCTTQTTYENRTTAYNVTYEYAGKQYTVQLPYDPGPTIPLRVSPMADGGAMPSDGRAPLAGAPGTPAGVILAEAPPVTYETYAPPAYYSAPPAYYNPYYARPYYFAPPVISLGFGYTHHHHRHRHHRH